MEGQTTVVSASNHLHTASTSDKSGSDRDWCRGEPSLSVVWHPCHAKQSNYTILSLEVHTYATASSLKALGVGHQLATSE